MKGYTANIAFASKDLSVKERIMIKDTGNTQSLDSLTQDGPVVIGYAWHAILDIHNEKSSSKDYRKVIVVDKEGLKYATGSEAFLDSLTDIVDEMTEAGEGDDIQLNVYRKESKNYVGKSFITCSLI